MKGIGRKRVAEEIGARVRIMNKTVSTATAIRPNRFSAIHRESQSSAFLVMEFESSTMRSAYEGPPLTLQQMREVIDWEYVQRL